MRQRFGSAVTDVWTWMVQHRLYVMISSAYFLVLAGLSIQRHVSFHSLGLDLSVFEQVFWNTIHGRFWEFSLEMNQAMPHSYFANHFSPFLILLVPVYFLIPHTQTLLVLQSLALALGSLPVYMFALDTLKSTRKALFAVAVYCSSLFIAYINFFDFHEVAFFIPLFGCCLLYLYRKQWLWFWVFLVLSLSVKEEIGLIGAGLGIFLLLMKEYRRGVLVLMLSLAWSALAIKMVIPHFAQGDYLFASYRYTDFGATTNEIVGNLLRHPVKVAQVLLRPAKVYFVVLVLASTGFVSLLAGWLGIVLAIPLLYLLLSSYQGQYSYTTQYSAVLIPTLLFMFILGLKKIDGLDWRRFVYIGVLLVVVAEILVLGPVTRKVDASYLQADAHYQRFETIKAKIALEASLAAQDFVMAHLSQRRYLEFYAPTTEADYVFLDSAAKGYDMTNYQADISQLVSRGYVKVDCDNGLCLLRHSRMTL